MILAGEKALMKFYPGFFGYPTHRTENANGDEVLL
jgi:hypothetical protein